MLGNTPVHCNLYIGILLQLKSINSCQTMELSHTLNNRTKIFPFCLLTELSTATVCFFSASKHTNISMIVQAKSLHFGGKTTSDILDSSKRELEKVFYCSNLSLSLSRFRKRLRKGEVRRPAADGCEMDPGLLGMLRSSFLNPIKHAQNFWLS